MNRLTVLLSLAGFAGLPWIVSQQASAQECRASHAPAAVQVFHEGETVVTTSEKRRPPFM